MPLSIGVNLRVTGHCNQGGRKYMEDMFSVAFQPTPDDKDLEYAFFGIFDGHGGGEAATFAKEHLMDIIVKQKNFWSDRDEDVLRAIRDGYVNTHYAMWRELEKWPRTASGLPSTAGTTASIAFIRKGKIYIGHVGDSGIILGYQVDGDPQWRAKALTKDHKPESGPEMIRIQQSGGKVVSKSGVPRVVWNRPRIGHKGPVRRSTHIDEIPFLAVARSLGDLWSYNSELNTFVVSPEPDVKVVAIDVKAHRCLIFGTDGLWNMLTPHAAVAIVQAVDRHNEKHLIASQQACNGQVEGQMWINPSKSLVDRALERWSSTRLRADNTSVVTLMLDPPGPSRSEVLLSQKERIVMHHTVLTPASVLSPAVERSVPRPPALVQPNLVELKQPDSSDDTTEDSHVLPAAANPVHIETSTETITEENVQQQPPLDAACSSLDDANPKENIQVAEVSSSQLPEESTEFMAAKESETIEIEKSVTLSSEEIRTNVVTRNIYDCEGVRVCVREGGKMQSVAALKRTNNESISGDVFRQDVPSDLTEDTKLSSPCPVIPPGPVKSVTPELTTESKNSCESGVKSNILVESCQRQSGLFVSPRVDDRDLKRRHSVSSHLQNNSADPAGSDGMFTTRFKSRTAKLTIVGNAVEEASKTLITKTATSNAATKRRHSAITQIIGSPIEDACIVQEPSAKRRTRSEDRRSPTDENDPANQAVEEFNGRLGWPLAESSIARSANNASPALGQERLSSQNNFSKRSLGKVTTPVKPIRRSSINNSSRLQQLRSSFGLREWDQGRSNRSNNCTDRRINRTVTIIGPVESTATPQRWLRSDTIAATPVKALRSRNVDITGHTVSPQLVHQYGVAKQNRHTFSSKLKQVNGNNSLQSVGNRVRSSSISPGKLKQTNANSGSVGSCPSISPSGTSCSSNTGMAKRVKSSYNPSARSLSTRSRIKRLGK